MVNDETEELLSRCRLQDSTALDGLITLHQDRFYRLALRGCRNAALARQATVEAFALIWRWADLWRGEIAAVAWVYQKAVQTALHAVPRRRRWWRRWFKPTFGVDTGSPPKEAANQQDGLAGIEGKLQAALGWLSVEERLMLHLHYGEHWNAAGMAILFNITGNELRARLDRARRRLRGFLETDREPA